MRLGQIWDKNDTRTIRFLLFVGNDVRICCLEIYYAVKFLIANKSLCAVQQKAFIFSQHNFINTLFESVKYQDRDRVLHLHE